MIYKILLVDIRGDIVSGFSFKSIGATPRIFSKARLYFRVQTFLDTLHQVCYLVFRRRYFQAKGWIDVAVVEFLPGFLTRNVRE